MEKIIIGIDPGEKGFVAVIKPNGNIDFLSLAESNNVQLSSFLDNILREAACYDWGCIGVMEEVHAVFNSSAKSTFRFGSVFGFLQGIFVGKGIPYHLVQPKEWQKAIWINADMVYESKTDCNGKTKRVVATKKCSMNAAIRLFPRIDFRKNTKCRNMDDNKVDSLLIAEFARRKNL